MALIMAVDGASQASLLQKHSLLVPSQVQQ
jgi:hypothetical protein